MSGLQWWDYLHVNGSVQLNRYFGPEDISEARESPFVVRTCGPFNAESRGEALTTAGALMGVTT